MIDFVRNNHQRNYLCQDFDCINNTYLVSESLSIRTGGRLEDEFGLTPFGILRQFIDDLFLLELIKCSFHCCSFKDPNKVKIFSFESYL